MIDTGNSNACVEEHLLHVELPTEPSRREKDENRSISMRSS